MISLGKFLFFLGHVLDLPRQGHRQTQQLGHPQNNQYCLESIVASFLDEDLVDHELEGIGH